MLETKEIQERIKKFDNENQETINRMKKELTCLELTVKEMLDTVRAHEFFRSPRIPGESAVSERFRKIEKIAECLMQIFNQAKDGKLELNTRIVPTISEGVKACQKLLDKEEIKDYEELLEQLKGVSQPAS
jgi:chemotaxis protein histidine kinase CheA